MRYNCKGSCKIVNKIKITRLTDEFRNKRLKGQVNYKVSLKYLLLKETGSKTYGNVAINFNLI